MNADRNLAFPTSASIRRGLRIEAARSARAADSGFQRAQRANLIADPFAGIDTGNFCQQRGVNAGASDVNRAAFALPPLSRWHSCAAGKPRIRRTGRVG